MMNLAEIKPRMLMGPGPSDVNPRVLEAMSRPTIGHLDGQFLAILNEIRDMLRSVFQTRNELTLAVMEGTNQEGFTAQEIIDAEVVIEAFITWMDSGNETILDKIGVDI